MKDNIPVPALLRLPTSRVISAPLAQVRAAHAGDCADTSDAFFGYPRKWCVRLNARVATQNMFPQGGQAAVDRVFDRCYADCSPMPHGDGASVPAKQSSGESGEPTVPSAKPGE